MPSTQTHPRLVADIGGSNARFGWIAAPGVAVAHVRKLAVADHDGPASATRSYLAELALLGSFAGNVALMLGARGGVFIGGGIVPRIADRFFASAFRERFESKGRLSPYVQAIPTALITDTLVALTGAAAGIEQAVGPASAGAR